MAAVDVVAGSVVEEVGDEPLDEAWVAGRPRRLNRGAEGEAVVVGGRRGGAGDGGEVDGLMAGRGRAGCGRG